MKTLPCTIYRIKNIELDIEIEIEEPSLATAVTKSAVLFNGLEHRLMAMDG